MCALVYEHLNWKPHEGVASGFEHVNSPKVCSFHPNHGGHTIDECVLLKARICHQIDIVNTPRMWGYNTVLTYDQSEENEHTQIFVIISLHSEHSCYKSIVI